MRSVVPILILLAAFAIQPVAAKEPRLNHSTKMEKNPKLDSKAGTSAGKGTTAKGTNPDNAQTRDKTDAGVAVPMSQAGNTTDKAHSLTVKVAKPVGSQARGLGVAEPAKPVVRNSIGQIVSHPQNMTMGDQHVGVVTPRPVIPSISAAGTTNGSNFNRLSPHPVATASNLIGNKGGSIRPSSAPAIGGPAKNVGGINGTAVRPKY